MLSLLVGSALLSPGEGRAKEMPNVVFILADDIGYGDLGCYGATKVKTPNIDRLAESGVRFTDAHSPATVCTPTRYSLLSGEYSFRSKGGSGILSGVAPLAFGEDQSTWAKMAKGAGYRTAVVGKWHLGLGTGKTDYNGLITPGPKEVGFDESFIIPATGDRVPCVFVENGRVVGLDPRDPIEVNYQAKVGDDPTGKERPDLLKVTPVVGHAGTIVNGVSRIGFMSGGNSARWVDEDTADRITEKACDFVRTNKSRPFFLYFAPHDIHVPQLPHERFVGTSDSGIRGDTIAELDWSVGQIMKTLEETGAAKNTILVFTSDNGAVSEDGYADPRENLNGHKVNGLLRGTKYSLYEGGHRVPMIVSWPARTPKKRTSSALVCHIDFFASHARLLGTRLAQGEAPDSMSMVSALFDSGSKGRTSLVHHLGGFDSPVAYRDGRYVLIETKDSHELYDLVKDPSQKSDVAKALPKVVERMKAALAKVKAGS